MSPSAPRGPVRRPGTGRSASKSPSGRLAAGKPAGSKVPLIVGAAAGGLILLVLVIALAGGSPAPKPGRAGASAADAVAPKPAVPDVSALEATGKRSCEEGQRLVEFRLNPDPGAAKEQVRADLEKGLKLIKEGLEAYRQAAEKAGKSYALTGVRKVQAQGIRVLCSDLEKEGTARCEEGLKRIQSTESRMLDTSKLTAGEKSELKADLKQGMDLIRDGMNLLDRSNQVSDRNFDTLPYTKARKAAAMKVGELQ